MGRMETLTFVLSILGAMAWLPIIIVPIVNHFRKVQANLFEFRMLSNGYGRSAGEQKVIEGAIIMLVVNLFIKNSDFYPTDVTAKVKLKNGKSYNAELSNISSIISANDDGTFSQFFIPKELEFNISRTIHMNDDNVKCIALIVDGINSLELNDLESIYLILSSGKCIKKEIIISNSRFPTFNCTRLLDGYETRTTTINNPELEDYLRRTQGNIVG